MDFIKAIETLKARNQSYVDRKGVSDYTRQSDDIIKALVKYYIANQNVLTDDENLNYHFSSLLDKIDWFKRFFAIFSIPDIQNSIDYDIIKIIERNNVSELNIYDIHRLIFVSEEIKDAIRYFVQPLINYYKVPGLKEYCRSLYPSYANYFNDIDTHPEDIDNIIFSAYRFAISRISFNDKKENILISSHIEAGYKYKYSEKGILTFYK